jgi:hypothetical protein
MSTTYNGSASGISPHDTAAITVAQSTDVLSEEGFNVGLRKLADFVAFLMGNGTSPTQPTLNAGWAHVTGTEVKYWRDAQGIVHIEGQANWTSDPGLIVFTLPAGYRPATTRAFICSKSIGASSVVVQSDGTVTSYGAVGSGWAYFDGIQFRAA